MKFPRTLAFLILIALPKLADAGETKNFDADWKFFQGDATNAEDPGFELLLLSKLVQNAAAHEIPIRVLFLAEAPNWIKNPPDSKSDA